MRRRHFILGGLVCSLGGLYYLALGTRKVSAGPLHVDSTNFAVGGRDIVAYFNLPKAMRPSQGVPGSRRFTADWKGAVFAFSSAENRDLFSASPDRYAPQFDGHCAWAAGQGYKAPASPDVWTIVEGKLYLNYSHDVRGRWEKGMTQQIEKGKANWTKLGNEPGATGDAEDYTPAAAPVQ